MAETAHPLAEPFRSSLRGLASSVTIVSTQVGCTRYGMVATAVMSLSMEPPSLALAINRSASIHDPLITRGAFVVNILSEWDEPVARGFSRSRGESRFAFGPWSSRPFPGEVGPELPFLANAQAAILCRVVASHPAGSHTLFVGEVADVLASDGRSPLVYCDGSYGTFTPGPVAYSHLKRSA